MGSYLLSLLILHFSITEFPLPFLPLLKFTCPVSQRLPKLPLLFLPVANFTGYHFYHELNKQFTN